MSAVAVAVASALKRTSFGPATVLYGGALRAAGHVGEDGGERELPEAEHAYN